MQVNGQEVKVTEKPSKIKADPVSQMVSQNVQKDKMPKRGQWEDESKPGNCKFILSDDAEITTSKGGVKQTITGKQLKEKYGIEGVEYVGNEPDFTPFVDSHIGCVEVEEITSDRQGGGGTFAVAEKAVAEKLGVPTSEVKRYMEEHRLTWHESADRKRVMAVPSEINSAFDHTGGISKQKSVEAVREVWREQFGGARLVLQRDDQTRTVASGQELETAIKRTQDRYKEQKRKKKP